MLFSLALSILGGGVLCMAAPDPTVPRRDAPATASAADGQSTACGEIVDLVNQGYNYFYASQAFACLSSVPFDPAVATRFVKYWNETIQFQSTLAYLKNPPAGYQQPAIDVNAGLDLIQTRIHNGTYKNEYVFEADLQALVYSLHDGHVNINAGVLSAFTFGSGWSLTSASVGGNAPPKVFLTDDIRKSRDFGLTPSAIKTINGEDTVNFLTKFAALNSVGHVEPHADWNALFSHPALDIQGIFTPWTGLATFYPGNNLTFVLENGTSIATPWLAIYNVQPNSTGPLRTGGDFYNYFVLGLLPASYQRSTVSRPTVSQATVPESDNTPESDDGVSSQTNWYKASFQGFPNFTDIHQNDLTGGGVVTGYFYDDIETAVLSVPSFYQSRKDAMAFSKAVLDFTAEAKKRKLSKCLIDLQQNSGGASLFAYFMFKAFFPDRMPFGGSRRRSFAMANLLGSAMTDIFEKLVDKDKDFLEANEWVITNRLNAATGDNFTSWAEYQEGPFAPNGDQFSQTERYDLDNSRFRAAAFNHLLDDTYLADQWHVRPRPFGDGENVVLLLDGLCSSTCSLFVEMMTREGARTVVMGGRPVPGPMQGAAGNRGAAAYSADELDDDFAYAREHDFEVPENVNATLPAVRDPAIFTLYAGFNLRDQVREDDAAGGPPLQFSYEAADCRVYYTVQSAYNMTQQWHDAVVATYTDPSLCVDESRGYSVRNNVTLMQPPVAGHGHPVLSQTVHELVDLDFEHSPSVGLRDGSCPACESPRNAPSWFFAEGGQCDQAFLDDKHFFLGQCDNGDPLYVCLAWCSTITGYWGCTGQGQCVPLSKNNAKPQVWVPDLIAPGQVQVDGLCEPDLRTLTVNGEDVCYDGPTS